MPSRSATPRRAGIYVRISDDKAADAAGVARQEKDCRDLAGRRGWEVGEVYVENDTSAFKRRKVRLPDGSTALRVVRPAFRRLLDDVASGAVTALVAYDLDRVARQPRDLEDLIDAVEMTGTPTTAVTGDVDLSTDNGIFLARLLVNVANKSSKDTARRVTRKQLEIAEAGRYSGGGLRPFGYDRDGVTVNEAEAAAVRGMIARLLAGESLSAVARWLDETDVEPVKAKQWNARSVHSIVTKARIAGFREHRGEIVGPATWPAIVDRDTWERVRITLEARGKGSTNTLQRWLTGLLLCGKCDHKMLGWQAHGGGVRYWCATPRGGCGSVTIAATQAEAFVEGLICTYLQRPDVIRDLATATDSVSVERARAEMSGDEAQLRELAGMWAAKDISTPEYLTARRAIEERITAASTIVRAALPGTIRRIVGGDVPASWAKLDPVERREVAHVVFPNGIRVLPYQRQAEFRTFDPERIVPIDWRT